MNLITRSKPEKSINVRVEGGYGTDLDEGADGRHGERYRAGGTYRYFSKNEAWAYAQEPTTAARVGLQ